MSICFRAWLSGCCCRQCTRTWQSSSSMRWRRTRSSRSAGGHRCRRPLASHPRPPRRRPHPRSMPQTPSPPRLRHQTMTTWWMALSRGRRMGRQRSRGETRMTPLGWPGGMGSRGPRRRARLRGRCPWTAAAQTTGPQVRALLEHHSRVLHVWTVPRSGAGLESTPNPTRMQVDLTM